MVISASSLPEFYYHDQHHFYLNDGHSFPISKYALLRKKILQDGLLPGQQIKPSPVATDDQLSLAHTPEYIQKVTLGGFTEKEMRRTGFPWSPELSIRSRHSVGGTIAACRSAIERGLSANLGGGTHHAHADHGEGYCVYNDVAVASLVMLQEGLVRDILICDCDVHQGNGTASILQNVPDIFTFSIHGEKNFPFRKVKGDLDVGLNDGTEDEEYLEALDGALDYILARFKPELVIYLAGADPYREDRLGRLALSKEGLLARDHLIYATFFEMGIPITVTMGGGYAREVSDIVEIHKGTLRTGVDEWEKAHTRKYF